METNRGKFFVVDFFSIFFHTDHNKCTMKWLGWKMTKIVFRPAPPPPLNATFNLAESWRRGDEYTEPPVCWQFVHWKWRDSANPIAGCPVFITDRVPTLTVISLFSLSTSIKHQSRLVNSCGPARISPLTAFIVSSFREDVTARQGGCAWAAMGGCTVGAYLMQQLIQCLLPLFHEAHPLLSIDLYNTWGIRDFMYNLLEGWFVITCSRAGCHTKHNRLMHGNIDWHDSKWSLLYSSLNPEEFREPVKVDNATCSLCDSQSTRDETKCWWDILLWHPTIHQMVASFSHLGRVLVPILRWSHVTF